MYSRHTQLAARSMGHGYISPARVPKMTLGTRPATALYCE